MSLRWYHKLFSALAGLLVAVMIVELGGRRLGLLPHKADAEYRRVVQRVGPLRPPYDSFRNRGFVEGNTEFEIEIQLNKLGFRGPDPAKTPPEGARRVLLFGDSYTAGWEVEDDAMWSAHLARWLNTTGTAYEVINLGFPGFGTDRAYLLYEAYGRQLNPDLVLLVMYLENDIADNALGLWRGPHKLTGTRPCFTLDPAGALVEHGWDYADKTRPYLYQDFPQNVVGWLNAHVVTYRLLRDGWDQVAGDADTGHKRTHAHIDPLNPTRIPRELNVLFSEPDAEWQQAWQITESLVGAFRDSVQANGADFGVVIVPPHMIVQRDHWQFEDLFAESGRAWDLYYPQTRMSAMLDALNIPALNPTQTFVDFRAATGLDPMYIRDRHFNPTGTCVFAASIANWLVAQDLTGPFPAYPLDPARECGAGMRPGEPVAQTAWAGYTAR